jgi:hypothetical protein
VLFHGAAAASSPEMMVSDQTMTPGENPKISIQQDNRGGSVQSHVSYCKSALLKNAIIITTLYCFLQQVHIPFLRGFSRERDFVSSYNLYEKVSSPFLKYIQ